MAIKKYLIWSLPAIWFGLTFFLTFQNGDSSGRLSHIIAGKICNTLNYQDVYTAEIILRDCAHFGIHFVLAFLTMIATYYDNIDPFTDAMISILICMMIAILDELGQVVIPGRSLEFTDILRNIVGILSGTVMFLFLHGLKNSIKAARQ